MIPTVAGANSGVRNTAAMRACNSNNVFVGEATFGWPLGAVSEGVACGIGVLIEVGSELGPAKGVAVGVGVGEAVGVAVARRSRFGACCAGAKVIAAGVSASSKRKLINLDKRLLLVIFTFN